MTISIGSNNKYTRRLHGPPNTTCVGNCWVCVCLCVVLVVWAFGGKIRHFFVLLDCVDVCINNGVCTKKVQYLICCVFEVDPGVYASGAPQPVASILVTSRITRSDTGISKLLDLLSVTFTFCMVIAASFITILACNGSHDS